MKYIYKKTVGLFFVLLFLVSFSIPEYVTFAETQDPCSWSQSGGKYCLLAPLGNYLGQDGKLNIAGGGLSAYLKALFNMGIVLATGLAVIMITMGGLKYVSTDAINGKSEGKEMIQQALIGLVLALMAVLILRQINPQLLNSDLKVKAIQTGSIQSPEVNLESEDGDSMHGNRYTKQDTSAARLEDPNDPSYYLGGPDTGNSITNGVFSKSGLATNFGYNDGEDNGMGSPSLNPNLTYGLVRQSDGSYKNEPLGIITNDANVRGVALPQDQVRSTLGITGNSYADYAPARKAGVLVQDQSGKSIVVPIVDFGPGAGPQSRGVVIDETHYVNQYFGGDGNRSYTIIPNYYPNR